MEELHKKLIELLGPQRVKEHEPMDSHTAFRAGGETRLYVEAEKTDELVQIVTFAKQQNVPVKVLGSGTNMLVSEKGFSGVIIKNNCRRFEVVSMTGKIQQQHLGVTKALLYCEAGALMNQVVRYTIEQGLQGLEYQLGLPGTVGGGVYMNSQYSPQSAFVGDSLYGAKIITPQGEIKEVDREYFQFGFDYSFLQKSQDILISVVFLLDPSFAELLWDRAQEASEYRISEQPRGIGTGMTYRNMQVEQIDESAYSLGKPGVEQVLRESGGLTLGCGDVKLYEKRYNYILNMGEAKISDVKRLATEVKKQVNEICHATVHFNAHVVEE